MSELDKLHEHALAVERIDALSQEAHAAFAGKSVERRDVWCGFWRVADLMLKREAQARREGVLIGVRAGIEAAAKVPDQHECGGPDDIVCQHTNCRTIIEGTIRALDAKAIAERACKGGSGE